MRWPSVLMVLLSLSLAVNREAIIIDQLMDGEIAEVSNKGQLRELLAREGELQLIVPEVTPWTVYLTQLHRDFGPSSIFIGQDTAEALCQAGSVMGRNLTRVLPSEGIEVAFGLLLPPEDEMYGVVLEGTGLYQEMMLIDLPEPLEARFTLVGERAAWANVSGSVSAGELVAEVYFAVQEWIVEPPFEERAKEYFEHPWNGQLRINVGRGNETLRLSSYFASSNYQNARRNLLTGDGDVVGHVTLNSDTQRTLSSYGNPLRRGRYCSWFGGNALQIANSGNWSFVINGERYYTRNCTNYQVGFIVQSDRITCDVYDEAGNKVVSKFPSRETTLACADEMLQSSSDCQGMVIKGYQQFGGVCASETGQWSHHRMNFALPSPRYQETKLGEHVDIFTGTLTRVTVDEFQGVFPIEAGGWVTVNGERFYIPELAAFGIEQDSYIAFRDNTYLGGQIGTIMSLGSGGTIGGFFGGAGIETPLAPVSLMQYCQERFDLTPVEAPAPTPVFNEPPKPTPPVTVEAPEFDFDEGEGEELGDIEPDPWEPPEDVGYEFENVECIDWDDPPGWVSNPEYASLIPWIPECNNDAWEPPCLDLLDPPDWFTQGLAVDLSQITFCLVCEQEDGTFVSESGTGNELPVVPPDEIPHCEEVIPPTPPTLPGDGITPPPSDSPPPRYGGGGPGGIIEYPECTPGNPCEE